MRIMESLSTILLQSLEQYTQFLAQASALQSVAVQVVDWQRRKWTSIFTTLFFSFSGKGSNLGFAILRPPGGHFVLPISRPYRKEGML